MFGQRKTEDRLKALLLCLGKATVESRPRCHHVVHEQQPLSLRFRMSLQPVAVHSSQTFGTAHTFAALGS